MSRSIVALIDALGEEGGIARVERLATLTGRSARTVREQARRAGLWAPFRDVRGLPRTRPSTQDRALAAALQYRGRTGDPARDVVAVTRRTALALLGLQTNAPTRVELVVQASRSLRVNDGCEVLRSEHLRSEDVIRRERVPTLRGAALVRDLAAVRTTERLRADVIELRRLDHVTVPEIADMLTRCRFFEGRARVRKVVDDLAPAGRVDSPLELEVRRRFQRDGLLLDPGQICVPARSGSTGRWRMHLDLGIAILRFGIEVDSFGYHASPEALRRDAARANRLAALPEDWRVLHITWGDLQDGWVTFVELAREVIFAQAARFGLGADAWRVGREDAAPDRITTGLVLAEGHDRVVRCTCSA